MGICFGFNGACGDRNWTDWRVMSLKGNDTLLPRASPRGTENLLEKQQSVGADVVE